jgi:hypothetical protein
MNSLANPTETYVMDENWMLAVHIPELKGRFTGRFIGPCGAQTLLGAIYAQDVP